MAPVPFLDLGAAYRELAPELDAAALRVLRSGWYVLGPEVEAFEDEFATYVGTAHAVGVGSGLDALTLALRALDIGPGDEVIVAANAYVACWLAISATGARIVAVEPDPATCTLDPATVAAAIGPRTAAVMAVHLHGRAARAGELRALCDAHGLALVEDAAQAHGAITPSGRAGAVGHVGCFSFYPSKNLGAHGDGGAITTSDPALAERVRVLRNYGSRERYRNEERGVNSRLDPLQAALLRVKLPHLDAWNARRRALAARYDAHLPEQITRLARAGDEHVHHLYVVRVDGREELRAALAATGIATQVHYPIPPHRSGAYADHGWARGAFAITEALADSVLSLPIGPHLPAADVDRVCAALGELTAPALAA